MERHAMVQMHTSHQKTTFSHTNQVCFPSPCSHTPFRILPERALEIPGDKTKILALRSSPTARWYAARRHRARAASSRSRSAREALVSSDCRSCTASTRAMPGTRPMVTCPGAGAREVSGSDGQRLARVVDLNWRDAVARIARGRGRIRAGTQARTCAQTQTCTSVRAHAASTTPDSICRLGAGKGH
jgi:hypothetical protein